MHGVCGIDFQSLKEAFDALSFTKPEQKQILTIVSLILALGNVEFQRVGDKECTIPDRAWLDVAAGLLQVLPYHHFALRIHPSLDMHMHVCNDGIFQMLALI
jgi:myosin heavy subunit